MRNETWRSIIRIMATVAALFGLVLMGNEILEQITSCNVGRCERIHLGPMLWGITLMAFGLLILQRGDVTMSLKDITTAGNHVASWFGRRAYDRKSGKVAAVVAGELPVADAIEIDRDKDERVERPRFRPREVS